MTKEHIAYLRELVAIYDECNEPPDGVEELGECLDEIEKLRAVVARCSSKFREYENIHGAKLATLELLRSGLPEDEQDIGMRNNILIKMQRNREMAEVCEEVLK